jgi:hypothetical protein
MAESQRRSSTESILTATSDVGSNLLLGRTPS